VEPTFEENLAAVIARRFEGAKLASVNQLTAGASQQTFRLTVEATSGEASIYAFRRAQPDLESSSYGQLPPSLEVELLKLAADGNVPVPEIHHVLTPEDGLGDGYIMEWLDGETMGQRIIKLPELAKARESLAFECGQALARIHALPVENALSEKLHNVSPEALVRETWDAYVALDTPQPMIDYTAQWLLGHLPKDSRTTLVHGDFRNGNLMVTPDGIKAVLDWELCHIGDPMRDLGWLCVNSWRFGNRSLPVGGFGRVEDLVAGYESVSNHRVDRDALRFWEVFGSFWWSITTLGMAKTWRTGETPSVERPVIGRRSTEAQMDCVNLLIPGQVEPIPEATEDQNLPSASELISSVQSHLREHVAEKLEGADKFLVRVAINSLSIAQRELSHRDDAERAEYAGLKTLLIDLNRADEALSEDTADMMGQVDTLLDLRWRLVVALRGNHSLDRELLAKHLRQTVAHRLCIDQPKYSALSG
jgi:aminoglycoside phosphotransferase (APT) family kinase protein